MIEPIGRALRRLRAFIHDARGNVLMIFGLALVPLAFATGMGIDYGSAMRLKTKLDAAADAASLAATTTPMLNKTMVQACTAATNMFVLQSSNLTGLNLDTSTPSGLTITVVETYSGAGSTPVTATCGSIPAAVVSAALTPVSRIVTVKYRGFSNNTFSGLLNMPTLTVSGVSSARVGLATYYQIIFAVDVSSSMGIGGTSTDVTNLTNDKAIQCAFACHDPNGTSRGGVQASDYCDSHPTDWFCHNSPTYCPYGGCTQLKPSKTFSDRRGLARTYGYKLKIDYVNSAISSFMTSLQPQMQKAPNNYIVGIYTFGTDFTELQAPTNDWSAAHTAAGKIDLETAAIKPSPYFGGGGNQGWTFTSTGLSSTLSKLSNVGDGSSTSARRTFVIFLSDGVEDDYGQVINGRGTYYNYAQQCQAIKNAGISLFSIEASYPPITPDPDGQYTQLVANLPSRNNNIQIPDVMKACASSPDKYFLASDGPGIQTAVNNVFAAISQEASRLTQ